MRPSTNGVVAKPNANGTAPARTTLRLAKAREDTPPVDPVAAVKHNLLMSVYGRVGEDDLEAIVDGIVGRAKAGDRGAAKLILDLVTKSAGGKAQVVERPVMVEAGARQLRLLCAYAIDKEGPMPIEALSRLTGMTDSDTATLLDGCWFVATDKGVALTAEGRKQVG